MLNVIDALEFQKWMLGLSDTDIRSGKAADLYSDGKVNIADFCILKNKLLGMAKL